MALTRAEKQTIALNNKIQLQTIRLALNNAIRDTDRRDLIDAFELKLESLEEEITGANDLLKNAATKRKGLRSEISTLTDRLEKASIYNFAVEGKGKDAKYYRIRRPNPKDIMIELDDPSTLKNKSLNTDPRQEEKGSSSPTIGTLRVPIEEYRIPIEKDVYDSFIFENKAIKELLKEKQGEYNKATETEAELIAKYATKNDKSGKTGLEDLKFKAALLTEQLATENIFLDAYINNKDQFTGVMYDEDRKQYTPINYDKLMETTDYGAAPTAFKLDVSKQQKDLENAIARTQEKPFYVAPKSWWKTFSGYGPLLKKQEEDFMADFTSGYILLPKTKDGKRITRGDSATQEDIEQGLAPDGMNFFGTQNPGEVKTVMPGIPNRNFSSKQRFVNQMNTQRAMQRQIRPLLGRKNQNMNPSGFNMKKYLDK